MADLTPAVRLIVYARAFNRCELCGAYAYGGSVHHRRRRGMGGTRRAEINQPANLLLLCGSGTTGCHGLVEARDPSVYALGLLLRDHQRPSETPVRLKTWGWVLLDDDGCIHLTDPPEGMAA